MSGSVLCCTERDKNARNVRYRVIRLSLEFALSSVLQQLRELS